MKLLPKKGHAYVFVLAMIFITCLGPAFVPLVFADSSRRVIRVGAYDNPPKIGKDLNGTIIGFWPDLIQSIADHENWRIEYVWGTWRQCLDRLEKKQIDMLPDTGFTEKRAQKYVFSAGPVLLSWARIYVRSYNSGIKTILDLDGRTIAVLAGSVNFEGPGGLRELAAGFHLNCRFMEVDDYQKAFEAVKDGRADACVTNRNFGNKNAARFGLVMTPVIFQPLTIKFAFPMHSRLTPGLVKIINARMRAFEKNQDSDYYRLLKKYFEGTIAEKKVSIIPKWIWIVIKVSCGLLLFALMVIVCTTIAIRRKTRELFERNRAVMDRELLYRLLFENVPAGVFHYDKNLCVTESNTRFVDILKSSRDRIIGLDMKTIRDRRVLPALKKPFSGKEGFYEGPYMSTTGGAAEISVRMQTAPIKDDRGSITGAVGIVEDITQRLELEKELKRLAVAMDQAAETVVVTDAEANIQYVNPAFERITGYAKDEVIGENPSILKSGKQDEDFYRRMWDLLSAGRAWSGRFTNKRKDGSLYNEEATISPVLSEQGVITNFVAVKRDITEKIKLEEQLRQAMKMEAVGRLAGGVAHDFNNLLTIIIGNADILLMNIEKDSRCYSQVDAIRRAGNRAASLTRQLLAFSRKQMIQPEVLNVNSILKDTEKMLRRLIGEDINMECRYEQDLKPVLMDPGQIEQIVINLSVNARDAMPDGGDLLIETANIELDQDYFRIHGVDGKIGSYVKISVTDNGIGMDSGTRPHIFEPFFTTKDVGKGTGLGLSTVYGIVKQNSGYVWVYSEPGKGTTFKIYLPVHEMDEKDIDIEEKAGSGDKALYGTECVLVAEDEEMVRKLAVAVLKKYGYTVLSAVDGESALRVASEYKGDIHLLLSDVVMPRMGGSLLAQAILKMYPEIRVLFMSGYTDRAILTKDLLEPGYKLIEKPFAVKILARKVREVLDE